MTEDAEKRGIHIVSTLTKQGFTAYFAGGCVRDKLLLGSFQGHDIDIATSATPEQISSLFPKTLHIGASFGVIVVIIEEQPFEVATFRMDQDCDGRKPQHILFSSPEQDAQRRDFTINGMFWDPLEKNLYDFVDGQKDLEKKVLRAIGDPEKRFEEDRLRMVRAIRFASRLNFTIEEKTGAAICHHASFLFPCVSIERVYQELKKMDEDDLGKALCMLFDYELFSVIFPEIKKTKQEIVSQTTFWKGFINAPFTLKISLLYPQNKQSLLAFSQRFKLSNKEKEVILFFYHVKQLYIWEKEGFSTENSDWVSLYAHPFWEMAFSMLQTLFPQDGKLFERHLKRIKELAHYVKRKQEGEPILTSEILLDHQIKPGKRMGRLLKLGEKVAANYLLSTPNEIISQLKGLCLWL